MAVFESMQTPSSPSAPPLPPTIASTADASAVHSSHQDMAPDFVDDNSSVFSSVIDEAEEEEEDEVFFGPLSGKELKKMHQGRDLHRRTTQVLTLLPLDDVYREDLNDARCTESAVKIQSWWRGIQTRRQLQQEKQAHQQGSPAKAMQPRNRLTEEDKQYAAVLLQSLCRRYLARRLLHRKRMEIKFLTIKGSMSVERRRNMRSAPQETSRSPLPPSQSPTTQQSPQTPTSGSLREKRSPVSPGESKIKRGLSIRNWFQRPSNTGSLYVKTTNSNGGTAGANSPAASAGLQHPQSATEQPSAPRQGTHARSNSDIANDPLYPSTLKPKRSIIKASIGSLLQPKSSRQPPLSNTQGATEASYMWATPTDEQSPKSRIPQVTTRTTYVARDEAHYNMVDGDDNDEDRDVEPDLSMIPRPVFTGHSASHTKAAHPSSMIFIPSNRSRTPVTPLPQSPIASPIPLASPPPPTVPLPPPPPQALSAQTTEHAEESEEEGRPSSDSASVQEDYITPDEVPQHTAEDPETKATTNGHTNSGSSSKDDNVPLLDMAKRYSDGQEKKKKNPGGSPVIEAGVKHQTPPPAPPPALNGLDAVAAGSKRIKQNGELPHNDSDEYGHSSIKSPAKATNEKDVLSLSQIDDMFSRARQQQQQQQQQQVDGNAVVERRVLDSKLSPRLSLRLSADASSFGNFKVEDFASLAAVDEMAGAPDTLAAVENAPVAMGDQEIKEPETDEQPPPPVQEETEMREHRADQGESDEDDNPVKARLRSLRSRRLKATGKDKQQQQQQQQQDSESSATAGRWFRATQTATRSATGATAKSGTGANRGHKPLSKMGPLQLDRLTKLNTRRNSTYLTCKIEKYVVQMEGERPPSPTLLMQLRAQERKFLKCNIEGDEGVVCSTDNESSDDNSSYDSSEEEGPSMPNGYVLTDQEMKEVDPRAVGLGVSDAVVGSTRGVGIEDLVDTRPLSPMNSEDEDELANAPGSGKALLEGFQEAKPLGHSEESAAADTAGTSDVKRKSAEQPLPLPGIDDSGNRVNGSETANGGSDSGGRSKKLCRRRVQWGSRSVLQATWLLGKLPTPDPKEGGYTTKPGKPILMKCSGDSGGANNTGDTSNLPWLSAGATGSTRSAANKRLSHGNNLKIVRVACIEYPNSTEALEGEDEDDDEDEYEYEDADEGGLECEVANEDEANEYMEKALKVPASRPKTKPAARSEDDEEFIPRRSTRNRRK